MIRIYLDWNVISNLKKSNFKELKEFIDNNKQNLLFIYSPSHLTDLMKSQNNTDNFLQEDLNTLLYLSEEHCIRWNVDNIEFLLANPIDYYNFLIQNN